MSNDRDRLPRHLHRHSAGLTPLSQNDCPTEVLPAVAPAVAPVPTRRPILSAAGAPRTEGAATPFADWRGQAQTELLPVFPRVSTPAEPTGSRVARHLRAALAGIALAAAILIPMQLFAAQGIADARQAALASSTPTYSTYSSSSSSTEQAAPLPRTEGGDQPSMSGQPTPMSDRTSAAQSDVRSDIQPDWVTEDTGAAHDRTDPAASPLDLPRCTTSPDTPLPCLATISPDSRRAVVLEEDASLTALVRR